MAKTTIDDKEYDVYTFSDETEAQLVSSQYVDSELARLQARASALETARIAYRRALKRRLEEGKAPVEDEVGIEGLGDSTQFDDQLNAVGDKWVG